MGASHKRGALEPRDADFYFKVLIGRGCSITPLLSSRAGAKEGKGYKSEEKLNSRSGGLGQNLHNQSNHRCPDYEVAAQALRTGALLLYKDGGACADRGNKSTP